MDNLKIYQICHGLIAYFATLTSLKKSQLGLIFRTGGSITQEDHFAKLLNEFYYDKQNLIKKVTFKNLYNKFVRLVRSY